MTTTNDAIVQVNGGAGADFIDATNVRGYHTVQLGEGGNDGLLGGRSPTASTAVPTRTRSARRTASQSPSRAAPSPTPARSTSPSTS